MIPPACADALRAVLGRLAGFSHPWVLTGSLGLAVRGLPYTPGDIDLQTDAAGAYAMAQALGLHRPGAIALRESASIRSIYGKVAIRGIPVEVMGDIAHRLADGRWTDPPDLGAMREFALYEQWKVPVLPLAYEAVAYERMGREEKAAGIRQWLEVYGESQQFT